MNNWFVTVLKALVVTCTKRCFFFYSVAETGKLCCFFLCGASNVTQGQAFISSTCWDSREAAMRGIVLPVSCKSFVPFIFQPLCVGTSL